MSEQHRVSEVLRLPATMARAGLSRSMIYLKVKDGSFPAPIKLSQRSVGWLASEVDAWIAERIAASREAA